MVNDYDKTRHLSNEDMETIFGRPSLEIVTALNVLGIKPVEKYRPPTQTKGRPRNLYLRRQVEQALRHIEAFKVEADAA